MNLNKRIITFIEAISIILNIKIYNICSKLPPLTSVSLRILFQKLPTMVAHVSTLISSQDAKHFCSKNRQTNICIGLFWQNAPVPNFVEE